MNLGAPRKVGFRAWITADRLAALLFLALFGLWLLQGSQMHSALVVDVVGPGFFPKLIGTAGCILALILLFQRRDVKDEDEKIFGVSAAELTPVAMLVVYVLTLDFIGFPVGTAIFVAVACKYFGCPGWPKAILLGLVVTVVSFALFHYGLEARLPFGVLTWVGIGHA